jgi:hypothetical protein
MTGWPAAIDELGIELQAAISRREQRPWLTHARRFGPLLVPVGFFVVVIVLLASLGVFHRGAHHGADGRGDPATQVLPVEPLRASDPHGGSAWGVRLAVTGSLVCEGVGQIAGGRIGLFRDKSFEALPAPYRGQCARLGGDKALVSWTQFPGSTSDDGAARTVIAGVAPANAIRVDAVEGSVRHTLPLSARKAFVIVLAGLRRPRDVPVGITLANGAVRPYAG